MIWSIIKKQGLILLRNPQQLLLLIGLPIILIAILGASLSSFMNGESVSIDAKIALIEQGDSHKQVKQFLYEIEQSSLPEEQISQIRQRAEQVNPVQSLKDVFESEELRDVIQIKTAKSSEKEEILHDDSYAAVIEVPDNFTYDTLHSIFGGEDVNSTLEVYQNEGNTIGSNAVKNIIQQYQEQLTLLTFAGKNGVNPETLQVDAKIIKGETATLHQKEAISSKEYYAVGMAVMNVLYLASTIGSFAFLERKKHVFNRIILAGVSRWTYFIGIFISGVIFSFVHLVIIFGFCWLFYDVVWSNVAGFILITLSLAFAVGGLSVLLTAISFRMKSEVITNFFSNILVAVFAFLGGSFFPIGDLSKTIQFLGNLTPNGASMTAYLSILHGDEVAVILHYLLFLVFFAIAFIVIAVLSFPKRGQTV
ncbi:ABC transporter permease [Lentibacillus sp. Marseille-P4043]|uniref:ABC transporter permease n=1 Tax=Lentibacillus sp. Marseille-P4043 TaxID=2040293 RepID=UPI000D0ACFF4|nr:ABC transporter permease [Lentibacillus sp. Marseille-P4043]